MTVLSLRCRTWLAAAAVLGIGAQAGAEPYVADADKPARDQAQPSRASMAQRSRDQALAELQALNGAMPRSFDLSPADPCAGTWDVVHADGSAALKITVLRYQSLPVMHVSGEGFGQSNSLAVRQDPHSVAVTAGTTRLVLRCSGNKAVMELVRSSGSPDIFSARRGLPELPTATATPTISRPTRPAPRPIRAGIVLVGGNIVDVDADGMRRPLTGIGGFSEPVLSPDGHTIAAVHVDRPGDDHDGSMSLWLLDRFADQAQPILHSRANRDEKRTLSAFQNPHFSLDGGYVYIDADAWVTSAAVHQVNIATGAERFVIDGAVRGVIRTGPYRGYLLVQRHQYRQSGGSYDPIYVVRPDAKELFMVPGTETDDDEGRQRSLAAWLTATGGAAS